MHKNLEKNQPLPISKYALYTFCCSLVNQIMLVPWNDHCSLNIIGTYNIQLISVTLREKCLVDIIQSTLPLIVIPPFTDSCAVDIQLTTLLMITQLWSYLCVWVGVWLCVGGCMYVCVRACVCVCIKPYMHVHHFLAMNYLGICIWYKYSHVMM